MPPRNLLETRAALPEEGGRIAGAPEFTGAVGQYAEALGAIYNTAGNPGNIDAIQQQAVVNAQDRLSLEIDRRVMEQLPGIETAEEARLGRALTAAERDALFNECQIDQLTLGIISTARTQAEQAPVEVQPRGNAVTRGLGRLVSNPWFRRALYGVAAVGIGIGLVTGAAAGMAIAGGIGGVVSVGVSRLTGHIQGRREARAAREQRNTRAAVEGRNNELLRSIAVIPGETYAGYLTRVQNELYNSAATARQFNRTESDTAARNRRRRGFAQGTRDFIRGAALGAGFSGLVHGLDIISGGAETQLPQITPDQAAQAEARLIHDALANGSVDQLRAIPGLEHHSISDLNQLAHANGGHYAWNGAENIIDAGGAKGSVSQFLQEGFNRVQDSQGIDISKVTQPDGDWFFKIKVTDPNLAILGTDAAGSPAVMPLEPGTIHGAAQSELFRAMANGKLMSMDQALHQLGETAQVTPDWLNAQAGRVVEEAWRLENLLNQGNYNLPVDAAAGVAGGAVSGTVGEMGRTRRARGVQTPGQLAAAGLMRARQARQPNIAPYLQQPQTRAYIQNLPPDYQLAFARTINNMTAMPRAQVATLLGFDPVLRNILDLEDQA